MAPDCPECENWRKHRARFCGACGQALEYPPEKPKHEFFNILAHLTVTLVVFIILVNTVYGIMEFDNIVESSKTLKINVLFPLGLEDIELFTIDKKYHGALFASYLIVEFGCLVYAIYRYIPALKRQIETKEEDVAEKTAMVGASTGLSVSLVLSVAYLLFAAMFAELPDTGWMDSFSNYQLEFLLTRAGFREELMYRMLWIGLPLMIITLIVNRDKHCWKQLFGGSGMNKAAFILIVISSIMFGLAHNDGWGWSKTIDAFIAGIIFGYVYVRYGLYASIIMHTANDVISAIDWSGLGIMVEGLAEFSLIGLGALMLIYWIIKPNMENIDFRHMKNWPDKVEFDLDNLWKRQ